MKGRLGCHLVVDEIFVLSNSASHDEQLSKEKLKRGEAWCRLLYTPLNPVHVAFQVDIDSDPLQCDDSGNMLEDVKR